MDGEDAQSPGQGKTSSVQHQSKLTIRGSAEVRARLEALKASDPVASTSAVTLDTPPSNNVTDLDVNGSASQPSAGPTKPWGLANYGIPASDASIAPDPAVEAKLRHFHTLRTQGIHFNASLQGNKSFRNPAILSKLVNFVNVDEKLSAFPPEVWSSSSGVANDAWADRIAELQKQRSEEREKAQERGKRSNIDFTSSAPKERISVSSSSKDDSRRPSRWNIGHNTQESRDSGKRYDDRQKDRYRDRDRSRSPVRRR